MAKQQTEETVPVNLPQGSEVTQTFSLEVTAENAQKTSEGGPPEDTTPLKLAGDPPKKNRRGFWLIIGFAIVIVGLAAGGLIGYNAGLRLRMSKQTSQVALAATTQFELGLNDITSGNLDTAQKRFEYVIQLDPNYPGAAEKLSEVMLAKARAGQNIQVASPVTVAIPTQDNRGEEQLLNYARQLIANHQWSDTIGTLDNIRNLNPQYKSVQVDGLYYVALRHHGIEQIAAGNLEEGIYDFALVESFGPLDKEANGYRNWAKMYITGASFWMIDWTKVIEYFTQLAPAVPNLHDKSGYTTAERLRLAYINYGDEFIKKEKPCDAQQQYQNALNISPNSKLDPTATAAANACNPPTEVPRATHPAPADTGVPPTETKTSPIDTPAPPPPTSTP